MTEHEQPVDNEPEDPLDQLLRNARWPEPDEGSVRRLRHKWGQLRAITRQERARRLRIRRFVAVAAAIAVVAGILWRLQSHPDPADRRMAPMENPHSGTDNGALVDVPRPDASAERSAADDSGSVAEATLTGSRPATPYEQLLVQVAERRGRVRRGAQPDRAVDPLEAVIAKLIADPSLDVRGIAASLPGDRDRNEIALLRRLTAAGVDEQQAIARLLEHVGTARSVPALVGLAEQRETHIVAVQALLRHADDATLAGLANVERDPTLQQELVGRLLSRNTPDAVKLYLDLLAAPQTRDAAFAALDGVASPPIEFLFAELNGGNTSRRLAAALVLGRVDGPQVTERLVAQAFGPVNRQEALLALVASSGPDARRFVDAARRDQTLFAAVNSAQLQLQRLFQ